MLNLNTGYVVSMVESVSIEDGVIGRKRVVSYSNIKSYPFESVEVDSSP